MHTPKDQTSPSAASPRMLTRPYVAADAADVTVLFNLIDEHAGGHPGFTSDDVHAFVTTLVPDLVTDTRLIFGTGGELVAAAIAGPPPPGGHRSDLIGGVHPEWRGRGIGRELLAWQLDRVMSFHRQQPPGTAWQAHCSTMVDDEDALRLYRRFGMAPLRYWLDMTASTAQVPAVDVPDGLRVVEYTPDQEREVHAAHMEAFTDHWGYQRRELEAWVKLTVRAESFLPDLSFVAYDGEEIAGLILSYVDADPKWIYIGQVAVRRPWRRRGLAGALLARVLTSGGRAGLLTASLGVDADSPTGAVGVYERVGFGVTSRAVTYSRSIGAAEPA